MNMQHDCKKELKNANLQITPARIAALRLFESHDKPIDANYIISHLQKSLGIDRATVFRILNNFTDNGLIAKLEFGEGKARYELKGREDHHHLICDNCGQVSDVEDNVIPKIQKQIENQH